MCYFQVVSQGSGHSGSALFNYMLLYSGTDTLFVKYIEYIRVGVTLFFPVNNSWYQKCCGGFVKQLINEIA